MQFPQVLTTPKPFGIQVKWQWPEDRAQYSHLEIQYLYSGGDLKKQILGWPCESMTIGGLKAGERLQIRLRPIDENGVGLEWTQGDWIEGVSSSNAEEYLDAITCSSDLRLMATISAPCFKIADGEVFITDAFIKNSIRAAKLSPTPTISSLAKPREKVRSIVAGYMSGAASDNIEDVVDELMNLAYPPYALANAEEAVVKQADATDKAMAELSEVVRKAIQKECQPGGLLWNPRSR